MGDMYGLNIMAAAACASEFWETPGGKLNWSFMAIFLWEEELIELVDDEEEVEPLVLSAWLAPLWR